MPTDIWYIWYINVRRGARVDICVIIYDCVNKRDGENFQVVKNVFVHASGNILGVAFVSTLLFWEIIFKLKGKRICDQASALKWETLSHALQQKRYLKHLTDKELFYCKLEKVSRFADSSLLVIFVSLSSAPFFSFPFFCNRKQCFKVILSQLSSRSMFVSPFQIQNFRKSARISWNPMKWKTGVTYSHILT